MIPDIPTENKILEKNKKSKINDNQNASKIWRYGKDNTGKKIPSER